MAVPQAGAVRSPNTSRTALNTLYPNHRRLTHGLSIWPNRPVYGRSSLDIGYGRVGASFFLGNRTMNSLVSTRLAWVIAHLLVAALGGMAGYINTPTVRAICCKHCQALGAVRDTRYV